MMNKNLIRQSALLISVVVTSLVLIGRLDPLYPIIGMLRSCYELANTLAFAWLYLAIFRNAKPSKGMRIALAAVPILCVIMIMTSQEESFGYSFNYDYMLWARIFSVCLFFPLAGMFPKVGNKLSTNLVVLVVLGLGWAVLTFLSGYNAWESGFGIGYGRFSMLAVNTMKAGTVYSLIALSIRPELNGFFNRKWVKWTCVGICLFETIIFIVMFGFYHHCYSYLLGHFTANMFLLSPVVWYLVYCIFRFFKKMVTKGLSWKQVVFDI